MMTFFFIYLIIGKGKAASCRSRGAPLPRHHRRGPQSSRTRRRDRRRPRVFLIDGTGERAGDAKGGVALQLKPTGSDQTTL
jgi:hypothetical protein